MIEYDMTRKSPPLVVGAPDPEEVEQSLLAIAHGSRSPSDLLVTYDDMHGLWGGVTIILAGEGTYRRDQRAPAASPQGMVTGSINTQQIRELAQLLADVRAWEQQTEARLMAPDESLVRVTIQVGSARVTIWEFHNELAKNGRLVKIRDRMLELGDLAGLGIAPN
jgi:hypothetical protein